MENIVSISGVTKTYDNNFTALKDVSLDIRRGEIFALLGPNGAGKTTLIGTICGAVRLDTGTITVDGHDIVTDYRTTRSIVGLVPQELNLEIFTPIRKALEYQRGYFGKPADPTLIEKTLKSLSLWDKRDNRIMELSGGMKRRVLIAKALMNEPKVLFLDEPTAGVDVELRRDMWEIVSALKDQGVTIILTTHYIEEAEELADRIGVIRKGEIVIVDEKTALMKKLGKKTLTVTLESPLTMLPSTLADAGFEHNTDAPNVLTYTYKTDAPTNIGALLSTVQSAGLTIADVDTAQSSLEDIFVDLVKE